MVLLQILSVIQPTQRNATQRNATQRNATQRNATQRNATQRNDFAMPLFWYKCFIDFYLIFTKQPENNELDLFSSCYFYVSRETHAHVSRIFQCFV
ncbi:hypothetical protein ACKLNO_11025 [Neisseriaceae bacterium B1]